MVFELLGMPREEAPRFKRSALWPALRRAHLLSEPYCRACGRRVRLNVHHIEPVHVRPDLELDSGNLITLCEGDAVNCHLLFGHLMNWKCWNPDVIADAGSYLRKIQNRLGGMPR